MALQLPVTLHRKRTKTLVALVALLLVSAVCLIMDIRFQVVQPAIPVFAAAVFALALAFNIFLISEKTYQITSDRIECVSRLLPHETVEAKDITRVSYSDDKKSVTVWYDRAEYNLKAFLDDTDDSNDKTGMWSLTIRKDDIDIPIGDLKFILNSLLLSRERTRAEVNGDEE